MANIITNTIAATAIAVIASVANATTTLHKFSYQNEIAGDQFGYTNVTVDADGTVNATTKFTNGKHYDGDHFVAQVVVYGPNNVPLLGLSYGAGINATGGFGSANEAIVSKSGILDAGMIDDVVWIGVRHFQVDGRDDKKIWEVIGQIVEAIFEANSGDGGSHNAAASSARIDGDAVHYRVSDGPNAGKALSMEELNVGILPRASIGLLNITGAGGGGRLDEGRISPHVFQKTGDF